MRPDCRNYRAIQRLGTFLSSPVDMCHQHYRVTRCVRLFGFLYFVLFA